MHAIRSVIQNALEQLFCDKSYVFLMKHTIRPVQVEDIMFNCFVILEIVYFSIVIKMYVS